MATVFALLGDEVTLYTLQDILESFGHSLVGFIEVAEAAEASALRAYDLYLVDLNLEAGDPCALVRSLRERNASARIVVITSYPKAAQTVAAVDAGAQQIMRKPYEVGKILQLLEGTP